MIDSENLIQTGFLAERRSGVGGTDAAVIAGVSTFKRPLTLFYEKTGLIPDQFAAHAKNAIEWGRRLEPVIRKHYRQVTGRRVGRPAFLRHPTFPFLVGHVDGFTWRKMGIQGRARQKGILEIKTAFFTKRREWEEGGVPDAYYLQAQHYLGISGLEFASFAVLFGGSEFEFFDVARDQRVIDLLFAAEVDFWDRVQRNDPPAATYDALGGGLMRVLYPQATEGSEVVLTDAASIARMEQFLRLRAERVELNLKMDEHEVWLMEKMGTAERAYVLGTARAKWSNSARRSVDYDKLERLYPNAYADVVTEKDGRRLSIRDLRENVDAIGETTTAGTVERRRRKIKAEQL